MKGESVHPKSHPNICVAKRSCMSDSRVPHQVRVNRESQQRQYALMERAKVLGWPAKSVETIDEDQGRTATASAHRHGFKRLDGGNRRGTGRRGAWPWRHRVWHVLPSIGIGWSKSA